VLSLRGRSNDRDAQQLRQQPCCLGELLLGIISAQAHLAAELIAAAVHHRAPRTTG
jgi:hypothetical protein